jgi:hypothetical protein
LHKEKEMLSLRNAILGFAAVTVFSSLASAQTYPPLSCIAQPVDNPIIRDSGVTERVGDIKIICTGGTPTASGAVVPKLNLTLFTSPGINITSRLLGGDVTESVLLIDEPVPSAQLLCGSTSNPALSTSAGTCDILGTGTGMGTYAGTPVAAPGTTGRPNAFISRTSGNTSIVFNGVPFDPPGTGTRVLRVTNLRVNASQLNNVRGSSTSVNVVISTTTATGSAQSVQLPIGNPAPTVAIAQTPLDFSATAGTFLQCESQNYSSSTGAVLTSPTSNASIKYTERFASALRRQTAANPALGATAPPTPAASNDLTLQNFESESGFYTATTASTWDLSSTNLTFTLSTAKLGLADSGTRLLARFKNLPSGATAFYANHADVIQLNTASIKTGDVNATNGDSNGAGSFSAAGTSGFTAMAPVSGQASATWEVIKADTSVTESVTILLALGYKANTTNNLPTLGSSTADGQLAPLSTTATASASAWIPRFVEDSSLNGKTIFTINACRSNLLFPFVVNGSGYETGMAVVNTTKDPFGTSLQTGTCTLYYYGKSGSTDVCLTQTSKSITGGQFIAWTLGSGGDVPATPNFTGYAIASCNFQYAHGFAFISDTRVEKVSHGYLALVMDESIGTRTGSKSETLGQ